MASKAAKALLCIWIGPLYCPSPLIALISFSKTTTSNPFLFAAKAKTKPPIPPPATSIRTFFVGKLRLISPASPSAGGASATAAFTWVTFFRRPQVDFPAKLHPILWEGEISTRYSRKAGTGKHVLDKPEEERLKGLWNLVKAMMGQYQKPLILKNLQRKRKRMMNS